MIRKTIKYGVVPVVAMLLLGGLMFGSDLGSYVFSSARSIRESVKDNIPTKFELQRARDLLDEIVPEMHANIRLIAQEEVEIESLKRDIAHCQQGLGQEQARIQKMGLLLNGDARVFQISDRQHTRQAVKADLARRFDHYKEAELIFHGKQRLLVSREQSLAGATAALQRARSQKDLLADKIESLAAQHRLVVAASVGSKFQLDGSKLAQTEKLIGEIKKRLDVAERVLAHEGSFVQPVEVDVIDEKDLLTQVDEYFHPAKPEAVAKAPASTTTAGEKLARAQQDSGE